MVQLLEIIQDCSLKDRKRELQFPCARHLDNVTPFQCDGHLSSISRDEHLPVPDYLGSVGHSGRGADHLSPTRALVSTSQSERISHSSL